MEKIFRVLSSLKLAIALLVVFMVGLAAGTIVESRSGGETAARLIYYSWWFMGLQSLIAVNIAMSLIVFFPWVKGRLGFAVTHASILVILIGAAITFLFKTEGTLTLWEGESGSAIVRHDSQGCCELSRHELPFDVCLDKFVLDTYPGTQRPSGYASYVKVTDREGGRSFQTKIWMNNELKYRGYALFQSSYSRDGGRSATVLAVSRDPGQMIVFIGYITLMIGLVWIFFERATRARSKGRSMAATGSALSCAAILLSAPSLLGQQPPPPPKILPAQVAKIAELPVQHDGRAMPFDTFARDMVKSITGSSKWRGEEPTFTVLRWIGDPDAAANEANIKIGSAELATEMGYGASTKHAPFMELFYNQRLSGQWQMHEQLNSRGMPISKTLAAAFDLVKRLDLLRGVLSGSAILPIPVPGEPKATWQGLEVVSSESLSRLLEGERLSGWPSSKKTSREVFYNKLNPVRLSWVILLGGLGFALFARIKKQTWVDVVAFTLLSCGFAMMTWGIALRWQAGERIPAANMYESMLFLSWGICMFAVVAYALLRNSLVVLNAGAMAVLAMMLTDMLPMDRFIRPIAPVLAGTPWLAIHVPIIMVGYAVLALGVAVAHMQVGAQMFFPKWRDMADRFYEMLYWYNFVGTLFLLAGILTGSFWAAFSWGRYWGWDPKEVWSLVAFLAYMAIIHAKVDRLIGRFGVAVFSILAFQTVLMTYLGVNYVLTIGMHSYGMGDSPIAAWMLLVAFAELSFIGFGVRAYLKAKGTKSD